MIYAINIENAHEYGSVLPQLYRLRYRQFVERQGYQVSVYKDMEHDQYDTLPTVHLVYMDDKGLVQGCSRLNPTDRPYMLKNLWPDMVDGQLPESPDIWEATRICINKNLPGQLRDRIKWELVLGYLEFALANGIKKYIGVMPSMIFQRVFIRSGWGGEALGEERLIDGIRTRAAQVDVSEEALQRVQNKTGIYEPVLQNEYKIPKLSMESDYSFPTQVASRTTAKSEVFSSHRLVA